MSTCLRVLEDILKRLKKLSTRLLLVPLVLAKIGFDTAENEPLKVWRWFISFIHSPPWWTCGASHLQASSFSQERNSCGCSHPEICCGYSMQAVSLYLLRISHAPFLRQELERQSYLEKTRQIFHATNEQHQSHTRKCTTTATPQRKSQMNISYERTRVNEANDQTLLKKKAIERSRSKRTMPLAGLKVPPTEDRINWLVKPKWSSAQCHLA